ncbi:MAG: DUF4445 domain-containing protein [Candidatus Omnitrophica bacterium]|nr:DUF4445 domain-containing protein [Candidatus Omnitrophota bacterium]
MQNFKVSFYPDKKSVEVPQDTTILSAAIQAGLQINSACGGDGVCGKCRVLLRKGKALVQPTGTLSEIEKQKGFILSCTSAVQGDLEVEVPVESRLDFTRSGPRYFSSPEESEPAEALVSDEFFEYSPLTEKIYLELPRPTIEDNASDLERLYRQVRLCKNTPILQTSLYNLKQLGEMLRDADWKITVTLARRNDSLEVLFIEPGDLSRKNHGLAFDIGTTTISGELVDLKTKKILATKTAYNRQATFGSDVIARIIHAQKESGLEELHEALTDTMNEIIAELASEHNISLNEVTCVLCAGNTTMIHLLLSIDPTHIRKVPYIPTANSVPTIRATEADIHIHPRGLLACAPGVASYVGGDITSGILSSGLYKEDSLSILIDIGTNGEIALGNRDFIVSCAASAGPAFEGSGLTCGMRASGGAIQKVRIDPAGDRVDYDVIAGTPPVGICGSGYIDILAQMLKAGLIDRAGKISAGERRRIRHSELGKEFVLAFKEESLTAADIVINESDIDNLKRAKAAIYSATSVLARHMRVDLADIRKFFIAGGFGNYLDIENALFIGLLPDLSRERFVFIGNSSLAGAREMLLSAAARKQAEEIAGKVTYFELSTDAAYMDEYMAALFFPHTDLSRFPGVKF